MEYRRLGKAGYVINRNTAGLTAIPGSPIPVATGADTIASDPKGRFLFVGLEGGAGLAAFQIDPTTGALKPTTNSPFTFPISSVDVLTVEGNGKFLYVGEQGSIVHGFLIDQNTGDLSPMQLGGAPFTLNVATPRTDSSGKFLLGVAGFLLALPWFQEITRNLPGTFVRAPCRLTCLVTFALSMARIVGADDPPTSMSRMVSIDAT